MAKILITGAASGLGAELAIQLSAHGNHEVIGVDIKMPNADIMAKFDDRQSIFFVLMDAARPNPEHLYSVCNGQLDILINCAGINRINWMENVSHEEWDAVMDSNVKSIFFMTQAVLSMLAASKGTVLNIVSNAAHMPMTCSAAYNASKGAALTLTKQMARELTKNYDITVFSVSPNKLADTGMSDDIDQQVVRTRGWTLEYAREYQLKGLLVGEETPKGNLAEFIVFLLSDKQRHKYLSGCDIPYGL